MRRFVAGVVVVVGLASIFRVQSVVALVAAAVAPAALRRFRLAEVAALLVTLNVAVVGVPVPAAATAAARRTADRFASSS